MTNMLAKSVSGAIGLVASGAAMAQSVPAPVLHYTGHDHYATAGGNFIRYRFEVLNKADVPDALFAPAPNLPPCGNNANSARTWIDFYEQPGGRRIYGFCALNRSTDLGALWFALPEDQAPPGSVYIEMNDRQTSRRYRSNVERIP